MKKNKIKLTGALLMALMCAAAAVNTNVNAAANDGMVVRDVLAEDVSKDVTGKVVRKAAEDAPAANNVISDVKAQVSPAADGKRSMRFVAAIDSYLYDSAKFDVVVKDGDAEVKTYTKEVTAAYTHIVAGGETLSAAEAFGEGYNYMFAFTINNIPESAWGYTFEATASIKTAEAADYTTTPVAEKVMNHVIAEDRIAIPAEYEGRWVDDLGYTEFELRFDTELRQVYANFKGYETTLFVKEVNGEYYTLANDDGDVLVVRYRNFYGDESVHISKEESTINGYNFPGTVYQEFTKEVKATRFELKVTGQDAVLKDDGYYHIIQNDDCVVTAVNFYPSNANVKDVTWSVDNPSVGRFSDYTFEALGEGTVTLTATMEQDPNVQASVTFVVAKEVGPSSITVTAKDNKTTMALEDEPLQLYVEYSAGTNRPGVTWSVDDPTIATVSSSGKVTARAGGEVIVTATSTFDSSVKGTIMITIDAEAAPEAKLPEELIGTWVFTDDDYGYGVYIYATFNADGTLEAYEDAYAGELNSGWAYTLDEDESTGNYYYFNDHYGDCAFIIEFDGTDILSVTFDDYNIGELYIYDLVTFSTFYKN